MAYYTVRYSYTTVRTRLEFSETDLRTVSGYDQFAVNSSQVEFLLTVRTNILVKHPPGAINYKKKWLLACVVINFFKGPEANFSGPGAIPKFKKYLFWYFLYQTRIWAYLPLN